MLTLKEPALTRPRKPCNICGARETVEYRASLVPLELGVRSEAAETYAVYYCRPCALVYTDVEFDVEVDEAPVFYGGAESYTETSEEFASRFRRQAEQIVRQRGGRTGKLLDFGCGPGYFIRAAQSVGFDAHGFDLARGSQVLGAQIGVHTIHVGKPGEIELPGPFDVVTMYNVIEHLPDPLGTLRYLHELTAPGGLIVVETPNEFSLVRRAANLGFRLTGGRLNLLNYFYGLPPHHVYCFSDRSLRRILETAGFRIKAFERIGAGLEFIKHGIGARKPGWKPFLRARAVEAATLAGALTRSPTRMVAYAVKD